ncbi:MAG TPA: PEGA domain-containing protein [Polyangiaceae bacterium]|nr:PEGA domain-containing protein [Polyangiaceae bacterium]
MPTPLAASASGRSAALKRWLGGSLGLGLSLWALPLAAQAGVAPAPSPQTAPAPARPGAAGSATAPSTTAAPGSVTTAPSANAEGELSVSIADGQGTISLDGLEVGQGSFRGKVRVGKHQLRVTSDGYQPYEALVDVAANELRSESVALRPSVGWASYQSSGPIRDEHGLYGGVALLGALEPTGSGTTLEDSCDTTGATSCSAGTVLAGGLTGYLGWLFDPLGLEVALLASADVVRPSAKFDGENGSDINPIVARPAREEKFTIGRFGGGVALRGRVSYALPGVRLSAAAGPGLSYRYLAFRRKTEADGGLRGETAESGADYFSPLLSVELGAQVRLTRSLALAAGVASWFEHAGDSTVSTPKNNTYLTGDSDSLPATQATPAYHLANGFQWFIGPFLGVTFGP